MEVIKIGLAVTWGSGDIRAMVASESRIQTLPGDSEPSTVVFCVLTADYKSPCGRTVPKGTAMPMVVSELRLLQ